MHEKLASKGLTCLSVSIDPIDNKEKTLTFLKKQNAKFLNVLLDEPFAAWQTQFDIYGPPATLIFDRDGKLAARFDNNDINKSYTFADVEKAAVKVLEK